MKIPFVGPAYETRSNNVDAQRCVNLYLEMDNASPKAAIALYLMPGSRKVATLSTLGARGARAVGDYLYVVCGATVYKIGSSYTATSVGTLSTTSGLVSMSDNGIELCIVDGFAGYTVNLTTPTVVQITDVDFPVAPIKVNYLDGYFIVISANSKQFQISELFNGQVWSGADFASVEGLPGNIVTSIVDHREAWFFKERCAEVWVDTGNADFPIERLGSTFIETGCCAKKSVAKLDNSIFWLGGDERGNGIVWRANGYQPVRVSNHALEHAIQSYETMADAFAMTYQQEGHVFYVLTFPTAQKTWVYDASTSMWYERAWRNPNTNELSQWRPSFLVNFNGKIVAGDYEDGRLYEIDINYYLDDEDPIKWIRASQTQENEQHLQYYSRLQVDMEPGVGLSNGQGSDPQVMLRWSNNNGSSWSDCMTASVGKIGEYNKRVIFRRLGRGRDRVWEISGTDPVKTVIVGATVNMQVGES